MCRCILPLTDPFYMRNISRLFSSLFLLLLLNLFVKPLWILGIDRKVQLLTGATTYGQYFAAFNFVFIFSIIADLGITEYIRRKIAYRKGLDMHTFSRLMQIKLLLSALMAVVIFSLGILSGITDLWMLTGLCLLQLFLSWIGACRAILSGLQLFQVDAWLSVADKLLLVVGGMTALYLLHIVQINIHTFLLAQLATAGFTLMIALWFVFRNIQHNTDISSPFRYTDVFSEVFPFAVLFFAMSMHFRADGFLLSLFGNNAAVAGSYATMYRFLDAAHVAATLVGGYLVAFWSRHITDTSLLRTSMNGVLRAMISVAIGIIVLLLFHAEAVYQFFYHESNPDNATLLRWGLLALIPYFIVSVIGSMLTAKGDLKQFIYFVLIAAIVNLVLNILLIPYYGAIASVWIANFSHSLLAILLLLFAYKKYKLSVSGTSWFRLGCLGFLIMIAAYFLQESSLHLMWQALLLFGSWLVGIILLRLMPSLWQLQLQREK